MPDYQEGTLVLSTNSGRYAINDPVDGRDLTNGDAVIVMAGDSWVHGWIAHSSEHSTAGVYAAERAKYDHIKIVGYYVQLEAGGVLGLCSGMKVRVYR